MNNKILILYALVFTVSFLSCKRDDDFFIIDSKNGESLTNIIKFIDIPNQPVPADSESFGLVIIQITENADSIYREVKFVTDLGGFPNNDTAILLPVDAFGKATIKIYSNTFGKAQIKATVKNISIDSSFEFAPALPDDILLSADKYVADTSEEINVSTQLFRNPGRGKVSDPVKVLYNIIPLDTSVNLIYPDFSYSEKQVANITITNPYKLLGRFEIEAKVQSSGGGTLSKKILITIK